MSPRPDSQRLQSIGESTDFRVQFTIGQRADLGPLVTDRLTLPDQGGLVAMAHVDETIHTVVTGVDLAVDEPLGVRRFPVQDTGPGLEPIQFIGDGCPEVLRILDRCLMQFAVDLHRFHPGSATTFSEVGWWIEDPLLTQYGFNIGIIRHLGTPPGDHTISRQEENSHLPR